MEAESDQVVLMLFFQFDWSAGGLILLLICMVGLFVLMIFINSSTFVRKVVKFIVTQKRLIC